jgi:hypothetical protein
MIRKVINTRGPNKLGGRDELALWKSREKEGRTQQKFVLVKSENEGESAAYALAGVRGRSKKGHGRQWLPQVPKTRGSSCILF